MHRFQIAFQTLSLLFWGATAFAQPLPVATIDLAQANSGVLSGGAQIVDDALAQHGKALRVQVAPGQPGRAMFVATQRVTVSGPVRVLFHLRAAGLTGIAEQMQFQVTLRDQEKHRDYFWYTLPHAVRVGPDKYRVIPLDLRAGSEPAADELIVQFRPTRTDIMRDLTAPVTVWIDQITVLGETQPHISAVVPSKVAYRPGEAGQADVTLVNPTQQPFTGKLVVTDLYDLAGQQPVGREPVALPAGGSLVKKFQWKIKGPEAGRYLRAQLLDAQGKVLHEDGEYFAYAKDPSIVATLNMYPSEEQHDTYHYILTASPQSAAEIQRGIHHLMNVRRIPRLEHMGWDYNNMAGMMPPPGQDPYLGGERRVFESLKKWRTIWKAFESEGVALISYINGHVWGVPGYELFKKHPEWFYYTSTGNLAANGVDMSGYDNERLWKEFSFQGGRQPFFYGQLNSTLPAVRRHVANEIMCFVKAYGFSGIRWDCWMLDVRTDCYDLFGKPVAPDAATADRLWAESLAAVKALVAKECPDLTWGYNGTGPTYGKQHPLTTAEEARGGGWMLDEDVYYYCDKLSPYHFWEAYRDVMVGWGDHIRQLGGIYDPFAFHRGGGFYAVDRLYEGIFRLIAGGRTEQFCPAYENRASKVGELGHLAYRYNDLLSGWNLRLQPADQKLIQVAAPDTIWWRNTVLLNKSHAGKAQAIVHLVNSPLVAEVEDNPKSEVRPPVLNLKVTCGKQNGKLPARAWIVCAEPLRPEGEPAVQAVPVELTRIADSVSLTVPSVLYWKTVVFEY